MQQESSVVRLHLPVLQQSQVCIYNILKKIIINLHTDRATSAAFAVVSVLSTA